MHLTASSGLYQALNKCLKGTSISGMITAGMCSSLFLLVNPFLALFLVALLALRFRVPTFIFLFFATLSFSMLFFSREYGINWFPGSTDDVPAYVSIYFSNLGLTFSDLWLRFLEAPSGNEILWHLPWTIALNEYGVDENTFIFLHYVINFLMLFISMRLLSRRYWIALILIYFFLTPLTLVGIAHIWRQHLALCLFISGVALKYQHKSRVGEWFIYTSIFVHISAAFFVFIYWLFLILSKKIIFDSKLSLIFWLSTFMVCVPLLSLVAIIFLDSLGAGRVMDYFDTGIGSSVRVNLLLLGYAIPMLVVFFKYQADEINQLFLFLNLAVFSFIFTFPSANGIYDRLLMFTLPLMGLFFYRCLIDNGSKKWLAPALVIIFCIGSYRIYIPTVEHAGVMSFIGNGYAFDPFMGLAKMLID
jgi:hypothetical protein